MKRNLVLAVVTMTILQAQPATAGTDKLCKTLRKCVSSVKPDDKQTSDLSER